MMIRPLRMAGAWLAASILVFELLGSQPAPASQKIGSTLAQQLVGSWRLITWADREQTSGPWTHQFGERPIGLFIYTQDGHISIQVMRLGPPLDRPRSGPGEGRSLGSFHAYFGTFTVDETTRIVTHHVEASVQPNTVGTDQPREFTLEGNRLIIGDQKTRLRVLERLTPRADLSSR